MRSPVYSLSIYLNAYFVVTYFLLSRLQDTFYTFHTFYRAATHIMGRTLTYPKRVSNTANRYKHRATYDLGPIHSIINDSQVLHVSFNPGPDDPFPAILPMIGQMGSFDFPSASIDEPLDCYLHGYVSSRIMNLARNCSDGDGLPICVATSKVDGLILSLTPNSHSYNYRSAILHGYATLVTGEEEKLWAMKLITNSVLADRWDHSRVPPDRAEMQSTVILKVKIVDGSGKIRDGGVSDERKDSGSEQVTGSVWTGVVPVWETFGTPIPSGDGKVAEVPEYINSYIASKNSRNKALAESAAKIPLPSEEQH